MAKRPVFEEVSDPTATSRPVTTTGMIDAAPRGARRAIRVWLMILFVMVLSMIVLGGATRLMTQLTSRPPRVAPADPGSANADRLGNTAVMRRSSRSTPLALGTSRSESTNIAQ